MEFMPSEIRLGSSAKLKGGLWTVLALSASAITTTASAQTASDQGSGAIAQSDEIIVTARKQAERVSDVPIAISAFSEADIQRYATQSLTGLATQVPGLAIGPGVSPAGVVLTLRGISGGTSSATMDQAVSVNLDGLQMSQANLLKIGFHDMERIEVLKGPQALFYGKNSPGGVISLISADPGPDFQAMLRTGYEIYAKKKFVEGVVSTPLTDQLGLRVAGYVSSQDGWFRNTSPLASDKRFPGQKDYFVRGTLRYDSGTGFDNTLKVSYAKSSTKGIGISTQGQLIDCPLGHGVWDVAPFLPCKLDRYASSGDLSDASVALDSRFRNKPFFKQWMFTVTNSANLELGEHLTLSSVTTYYKGSDTFNDGAGAHELDVIPAWIDKNPRQFTQEVRVASSYDGPVNVMAGAFYQDNKYRESSLVALNFGAPFLLADQALGQNHKSYSIFGELQFKVTPQLDFNIGGRYTHEKKSVFGEGLTASVLNPTPGPIVFPEPKASFNNFSPEATLRYKPSQDIMFYATYRHGFISGGYNLVPAPGGSAAFDQEKVKGGEIGAKTAFFDRQLKFDIAAYKYKYKGLQVSSFDGSTNSYNVQNASDAKSYGIDLSLDFRPNAVPGLALRGDLSWNHARYGQFKNAPCYPGQTIDEGCNLDFNAVSGAYSSQNLTGRRLIRAADWSGSVGATYETDVFGGNVFSLSADGVYKSAYTSMLESDPRAKQKASWLLDATASLRSEDSGWEFAVIGKNLTNTLRVLDAVGAGTTGGGTGTSAGVLSDLLGMPTEPRSVMFQLTFRNTLLQK